MPPLGAESCIIGPSVAQWEAELVAQRPKTAKLVVNERLRGTCSSACPARCANRMEPSPQGRCQSRGTAGTSRTAGNDGG
jgi:hypothetical protein